MDYADATAAYLKAERAVDELLQHHVDRGGFTQQTINQYHEANAKLAKARDDWRLSMGGSYPPCPTCGAEVRETMLITEPNTDPTPSPAGIVPQYVFTWQLQPCRHLVPEAGIATWLGSSA
jgi:hypothetical protein